VSKFGYGNSKSIDGSSNGHNSMSYDSHNSDSADNVGAIVVIIDP
jgi:hypothetical protein